jgi:uncharacterized protein YdeI (YjbR/CyaY-like superfamily)
MGRDQRELIPREMKASKAVSRQFSAVLTRSGSSLNWVVIRIPFDAVRIWGVRGSLRVKGEINGFAFRTSLFPTGDGHHFMVVNKQMQKGARVHPGMEAQFRMEPDTEKRVDPIVPELERVLRSSKRLQKFYQSLAPSTRNFIVRSVSQAKHPETRLRRAEQAAVHLMETMEAEIELPPMIRQVFARNPEAVERWGRLSPSHRRAHLFGIFGYRNPEARLRRIEKAVAELIGED